MRLRNRYLISPDQPIDPSELATQDATSTNSSSESDDTPRMNADADGVNGNAEVTIGGRSYPAPNRYDEGDWLEDQDLCARAPWFDKAALADPDEVAAYAVDGWLPGELPLRAIRTWCWRNQFAVADNDLFVGSGESISTVRAGFVRKAQSGYERIRTLRVVPGSCMFVFRTNGEVGYFDNLNAIPATQIAAWSGERTSSMDAWCFTKPQLVAEFRYLRKRGSYFDVFVRNERRMRSRHGRAVPYQCLSTFKLSPRHFESAFPLLTQFWLAIEVPRGCSAELPVVFTYKAEQLMDCLLYTSPSPRDLSTSRMPSSA